MAEIEIPGLPALTSDDITDELLVPVHLAALPTDKDRKITKADLLADIVSETVTSDDIETDTINVSTSVTFPNGATVTNLVLVSGGLTFGDIAGGAGETQLLSAAGAAVGDYVGLTFTQALPDGLTAQFWVSAADAISVRLYNSTAMPIVGAAYSVRATVIAGA